MMHSASVSRIKAVKLAYAYPFKRSHVSVWCVSQNVPNRSVMKTSNKYHLLYQIVSCIPAIRQLQHPYVWPQICDETFSLLQPVRRQDIRT